MTANSSETQEARRVCDALASQGSLTGPGR